MAATKNGSGFQVLLDGAASHEGKFYLWDTNSSGVITKGSGWKTAAQATRDVSAGKRAMSTQISMVMASPGHCSKMTTTTASLTRLTKYHIFDSGKSIVLANS